MALLLVLPAQLDAFITQNTGELRYGNMRENYGKTKRLPASGKIEKVKLKPARSRCNAKWRFIAWLFNQLY